MKNGLSITEMAQEIQRREDAKRDFVADTRSLKIEATSKKSVALNLDAVKDGQAHRESFPLAHHALRQIESRVKLPAAYADRLIEAGHRRRRRQPQHAVRARTREANGPHP